MGRRKIGAPPSDSETEESLVSRVRKANGRDLEVIPGLKWMCLYVQSSTEYKVAMRLIEYRVLPLQLDSENVIRPLWPNYLFCRIDRHQQSRLLRDRNVTLVLEPADEEELIIHLKQFAAVSRIVPYEKDDKVQVKSGALSGFVATIDDVDDDARQIKIAVNLLGKKVQVVRGYDEVDLLAHSKRPILLKAVELLQPSAPDASSELDPSPTSDLNEINLQLDAINQEFIKYLALHPTMLYELEPRKFEVLIAELLKDMGYEVELTPMSRDGGRDILAAFNLPHGKILTLVECKRFKPDRKVGIDIVERFLFVIDRKDNASCGLIATTSYFSADAIAKQNEYKWRLGLKDFDGLSEWLSKYGSWTRSKGLGLWLPEGTGDLVP